MCGIVGYVGAREASDVLVGALAGSLFGFGVPLLHGVAVDIKEEEIAASGFGLFLGTVIAGALPRRASAEVVALRPELHPTGGGLVFTTTGSF